jgi:mannosyltransferase
MACFGLWGLARQSAMGNDEAASRWAASLSLAQLAHLLRHVDAVHGLYYLLLHGWMAAGTSPAVLRVPSVIAMVAAAALMVILARRLTGPGRAGQLAGLFAGPVVALSPAVSYYAQTHARTHWCTRACSASAWPCSAPCRPSTPALSMPALSMPALGAPASRAGGCVTGRW